MIDNITKLDNCNAELTDQSKTVFLFKFISELNKLKQRAVLNTKDYPWTYDLSSLPNDPDNIRINYSDRVDNEAEHEDGNNEKVILSVHKPEFQRCPEPDVILMDWLVPGWDSYQENAEVKEFIEIKLEEAEDTKNLFGESLEEAIEEQHREKFEDDKKRVVSYENWLKNRAEWVSRQKTIELTRDLFVDLYRFYFELRRESETEEIIVANGVICDANQPEICHPVLTRRVKIEYDADSNTVSIVDTDAPSELYSAVFQVMNDINFSGINALTEDLQKNDYHPLDRNNTPGFLKILVHQLSSSSQFVEHSIQNSDNSNNRLLLYLSPCFIVRRRLDGTMKAIEKIIENIQQTGYVPKPIVDIVSGGTIDIPEDVEETSIEERLAAVGGESIDVLLSKEANKEQLDIAKRIEDYNAVLVQGPPGTGKTHTIANLMGHFIAQGKSVLVTSYTKKALSVLKEKVAPGLQDLCVSMLDESNVDMEHSIDGITSYTSKTTSFEVKRKMDSLAVERQDVITKLAEVRKKIFDIINQECNCIVLNGEDISPSKAAAFVVEHAEALSYIPGKVRLNTPLPLSFKQLNELYQSNDGVTSDDERELGTELPNPSDMMTPSKFISVWNQLQSTIKQINDIQTKYACTIGCNSADQMINFAGGFGEFKMPYPSADTIDDLRQYALSFGKIDKWMKAVAVDGKMGHAFYQRWKTLIDEISKACVSADEFLTVSLGKQFSLDSTIPSATVRSILEELRSLFMEKGKVSKLTFMLHKNYESVIKAINIDGNHPTSADDCELAIKYINLQEARSQCSAVWNDLLVPNGVPTFAELDRSAPERIANKWVPLINKYLNWYSTDYALLISKLNSVEIPTDVLFQKNILDSELAATDKILTCVEYDIPLICDACISTIKSEEYRSFIDAQRKCLTSGKRGNSDICKSLLYAIDEGNFSAYSEAYAALEKMYEKYELQKNRNEMLMLLEPIAPQWAEAIRSRKDVHGSCTVPSDIDQAWKWKQLSGIIEKMTQKPFAELQSDSLCLSREYKKVTAKYAENSGWYYLLRRTEADIGMKQALEGWRLTVKSIGKGTGKRAPMLKAKARELMAKCQKAVPGWIMPINRALESLDPRVNKFDIIIIDEASQSDISSLAILYMGKKLIIVGDDRQVSPMAVGIEDKKIVSLQEQYITGIIPNAHLYTAKTSIYDVAKTTFQPLMLREHFRCVPEIIGFSNMLSYDGKIKPLRDESGSALLPAIVNYRVTDGQRIDSTKTNPKEAQTIIALMQACFEQPEYEGKSFGIISLLGDDQVKFIQHGIEQKLKPQDIIGRNVLCGNSANFQGDERDVIFLSLVDSGTDQGPIRMMNYGPDDAYRKRYNVAVSRARDQLWVVDSLDSANDLKPGDIRKTLIDYSLDPKVVEKTQAKIEKESDSPFEASVATMLSSRGYHIVQQWKVGSYRLDIVVVCGQKKVAIECDGERWHSGEEKIHEDMERQTVLERLGWRFIRIRGSEFYRDNEKAIERVISELSRFDVEPENSVEHKDFDRETELLKRVKARAASILECERNIHFEQDQATIAIALDPKGFLPDNEPKKLLKDSFNAVIGNKVKESVNSTDVKSKLIKSEYLKPFIANPIRERLIVSKISEKKNASSVTIPKESCPNAAQATSKHPMPQKTPKLGKALPNKTKGDDFVKELEDYGLEVIDNRAQSGIVWVLYSPEDKGYLEDATSKYNCKSILEKRGAVATDNRPAWRVMF